MTRVATGGLQAVQGAGVQIADDELTEPGYFLSDGCAIWSGGDIEWHDRNPLVARVGQGQFVPAELFILCAIKVTIGLNKSCGPLCSVHQLLSCVPHPSLRHPAQD